MKYLPLAVFLALSMAILIVYGLESGSPPILKWSTLFLQSVFLGTLLIALVVTGKKGLGSATLIVALAVLLFGLLDSLLVSQLVSKMMPWGVRGVLASTVFHALEAIVLLAMVWATNRYVARPLSKPG